MSETVALVLVLAVLGVIIFAVLGAILGRPTEHGPSEPRLGFTAEPNRPPRIGFVWPVDELEAKRRARRSRR